MIFINTELIYWPVVVGTVVVAVVVSAGVVVDTGVVVDLLVVAAGKIWL